MKKKIFYLIIILISCDKMEPLTEIVYKNNTIYTIKFLSIRKKSLTQLDTVKFTILPLSSIILNYSFGFGGQPLSIKDCKNDNCLIAGYDTLKIIFDYTKIKTCINNNVYNKNYKNTFCYDIYTNYTFTQTDYDSAEFINP